MRFVFALALLAAAVGAAAWHRASEIEAALAAAAQTAVRSVAGDGVRVAADGLDLVLSGEVPEESLAERARQAVEEIPGVRSVVSRIAVGGLPAPGSPVSTSTGGTPVVSWDSCRQGLDTLLTTGRVDFASGSDELDPGSALLLDEMAVVLDQCGDPKIEIAGHTDASGQHDDNVDLSRRRAEAIRAYLLAAGVAPERLTAVGYGPDEPVADNATRAGRARNRRIEFRVVEP